MATGRLPPHNIEAEEATLGAILLDAPNVLDRVFVYIKPGAFYKQVHNSIFESIIALHDRNESIDLITLTNELRTRGVLEKVGGASYIASLTNIVPSSANVEYYAQIVQQTNIRRRLITLMAEITNFCFDESMSTAQLLEEAERNIFDLAETHQVQDFQRAEVIVKKTVEVIEHVHKRQEAYTGIPSGFIDLDTMTSGFQDSEFIVIGARPSVGKTALAISMAANMSLYKNIPVGFFTLEMSSMALMQRLISSEARISGQTIRNGRLRSQDLINLTHVAGDIYDAPLWVSDTPGMRLLDLRAQARRMVSQHEVKLIFIDYLTLIVNEEQRMARHEQIAEISRSLKSLARELHIPIVTLSQVTRDTEGKRPMLSHIRESGSIEQDADVVLFLHRRRDTEAGEEVAPSMVETELIVAKQRNGPVGTVKLMFTPKYTRFDSITSDM